MKLGENFEDNQIEEGDCEEICEDDFRVNCNRLVFKWEPNCCQNQLEILELPVVEDNINKSYELNISDISPAIGEFINKSPKLVMHVDSMADIALGIKKSDPSLRQNENLEVN